MFCRSKKCWDIEITLTKIASASIQNILAVLCTFVNMKGSVDKDILSANVVFFNCSSTPKDGQ